jgi:hypothetical protein
MFNINTQLVLQAFGLVFIGLGVVARLGIWKKWYWQSRGAAYGYIPLGILFLLYSFYTPLNDLLGSFQWVFPVSFAIILAIGLWLSIRPPFFVKPVWVRWVEKHPGYIIEAMANSAKKSSEWEQHVVSEEAVDTWARSFKAPKESRRKDASKK